MATLIERKSIINALILFWHNWLTPHAAHKHVYTQAHHMHPHTPYLPSLAILLPTSLNSTSSSSLTITFTPTVSSSDWPSLISSCFSRNFRRAYRTQTRTPQLSQQAGLPLHVRGAHALRKNPHLLHAIHRAIKHRIEATNCNVQNIMYVHTMC